jgi:hypothetical protein
MNRPSWKPVVSAWVLSAALLTPIAGASPAAIPNTTDYRNATQPMITGTVRSVSQNELRVATEQGGDATLALDSHSIVPTDLRRGMMVRVEFHYGNDRTGYARRVIPIRHGDNPEREVAYSTERHRGNATEARFAAYDGDHDGWRDVEAQDRDEMDNHHQDTDQSDWQDVRTNEDTRLESTIPNTHAYDIATRPMISGHVTRVNDQQIVVANKDGDEVELLMDSRTLMPSNLQSGMGVRVDYTTLPNGDYLAKRVTQDHALGQDQGDLSYRSDTDVDGTDQTPSGGNVDQPENGTATPQSDQSNSSDGSSGMNRDETATTPDSSQMNSDMNNNPNDVNNPNRNDSYGRDETNADRNEGRMPRTASQEPLVALFGASALAAGAYVLRRRS